MQAPDAAADVPCALAVSPQGALHLDATPADDQRLGAARAREVEQAFAVSSSQGLLLLGSFSASTEPHELGPSLAFGQRIGRLFLARLAAVEDLEMVREALVLEPPRLELAELCAGAPPMTGSEYLTLDALEAAWVSLVAEVRAELAAFDGPAREYLAKRSPAFAAVGRVHFHLAENKRDAQRPFAFLATYATRLSARDRVQHAPLGRAIKEYAGERDTKKLLALLEPVQRAADHAPVVKALVDAGEIFHPLAWTPDEAFSFLQAVPACEAAGVAVRVPDWWKGKRPPRPQVKVTVGDRKPGGVGGDAMLDFDVGLTLDGEALSREEMSAILASRGSLVLLKGKWVEVDAARLQQVLDHWKAVEHRVGDDGVSFFEAMRLLAGASSLTDGEPDALPAVAAWSTIAAGPWLERVLGELAQPEGGPDADPGEALHATLRPYQRAGVAWLRLLARMRLGACLADDMGLGKTIQVLALLLLSKRAGGDRPHLVVAPASLLGNWQAEAARFAPSLRVVVAHASAMSREELASLGVRDAGLADVDLVLTTYGTVTRTGWFAERRFGLVVLDEAQAIKNAGTRQTRAVKLLRSDARIALTGTPVENRLSDLWSIFDFLCPGLLGSAKAFADFAKTLEADSVRGYAPLRALVRPYLLRRMKSDRRIVADLPDKTEVTAFCPLTKTQAALYAASVKELEKALDTEDGIKRRGVVLAFLMRFKQICNHPSQWLGDGAYDPSSSGKLARLRELCEPMAARQDKVLVFTQFQEMTAPLATFLEGVFGRPGLVLDGSTPVKQRAALVAAFQADDGPPFFVLSLKAGGTGLNLTAASHVVHFDRWWNPAVEDQATDRAYRIGQKRKVLVHKLCCRGTIEERIDALIARKAGLSREILTGASEAWITELPKEELMKLVALDLRSAQEER